MQLFHFQIQINQILIMAINSVIHLQDRFFEYLKHYKKSNIHTKGVALEF